MNTSRPVRSLAAPLSSGILAALLAAACSGAGGTATVEPTLEASAQPSSATSAALSASAAPSAAPANDGPPSASAWTDPETIQALARDCHWDPNGCLDKLYVGSKVGNGWEPPGECAGMMRLACARIPDQMCAPDRCSQSDYDCVPECDSTCNTCGTSCVSGCESCKTQCHDDACKLACAQKCGACHQACLTDLDHCTSAHCSEVQETCFKDRDALWDRSTCSRVCPLVAACVEKCPVAGTGFVPSFQIYGSDCANACAKKLMKGCPDEFDQICKGNPDAAVNFGIYHEAHQAQPPAPKPPAPKPPAKTAPPKGH